MIVLALEGSTSSAKAMLYQDGIMDVYSENYSLHCSDGLKIHGDMAFDHLLSAGRNIMEKHNVKPDVISVCSVWHGLLLLDKENKPLAPYSTWADVAGNSSLAEYAPAAQNSTAKALYLKTGCPPHGSFTLWKLKDTEDLNPDVQCTTLGEYFYFRLTGKKHQSYASGSGTGLMNTHSLNWDREILEFAGLASQNQLFELVEGACTSPLGKEAAAILGIAAGTPVTVSMPDGALNQIAAGGLLDPVMTLSVGTSGAMRITKEKPSFSEHMETWCYYGAFNRWICGGAVSGAGNCIQWFLKEFGENSGLSHTDYEATLPSANRTTAPYFLPFMFGERSPGWNNKRSWGFREERSSGPGDYYYALLEGILFNMRQSFDLLSQFAQDDFIADLSGGILNSAYFVQMAADIFGKEMHLNPAHHASAYGAVLMGMAALGGEDLSHAKIFQNDFSGKRVQPAMDIASRKIYETRYKHYLELYKS